VDLRLDLHAQPALHLLVLEHALTGLLRLRVRLERPRPAVQRLEPRIGPVQPLPPILPVLLRLLRTAIPQYPVALDAPPRAFDALVDQVRPVATPRVGLAMDLAPGEGGALQMFPKPSVLGAGPGHDRQEPSLAGADMAQVVP